MSVDDSRRRQDVGTTLESVQLDEISEQLVREAAARAKTSVTSPVSPTLSTTMQSETDRLVDSADEPLDPVPRAAADGPLEHTLTAGADPEYSAAPVAISEEAAPDAGPDEHTSEVAKPISWVTLAAVFVLVVIIIVLAVRVVT